ncbi:MAG: nucleotidyltransferase family protein [Ramlibacter sp.]|nr:nucleotidyltransferase family protein [Ramlibacter sp.]
MQSDLRTLDETDPVQARFVRDVLKNRNNKAILDRWASLRLPDGWLVAGCLFQTIWNLRSGAAAEARIKDYDIFYFDGADLSEEGERRVQHAVDDVFGDLGVVVEAKNQARVHLWYQDHFGYAYPPLRSSGDGMDRFLVTATCVGLRPNDAAGWQVYAPHGLQLLYDGVLGPNVLTDHGDLFEEKVRSYQSRWPWLTVTTLTGQC